MKTKELVAILTDNDEFLAFGNVAEKYSSRPDLHAFIFLNKFVPGDEDIVAAAEHDQIFLGVGLEELAEVITPEQALDLSRCGVFVSRETDSLSMFV